jgi:hypothetical protein
MKNRHSPGKIDENESMSRGPARCSDLDELPFAFINGKQQLRILLPIPEIISLVALNALDFLIHSPYFKGKPSVQGSVGTVI